MRRRHVVSWGWWTIVVDSYQTWQLSQNPWDVWQRQAHHLYLEKNRKKHLWNWRGAYQIQRLWGVSTKMPNTGNHRCEPCWAGSCLDPNEQGWTKNYQLCKPKTDKYRNKIFTNRERGAGTHMGLQKVHPYIYGVPIELVTDHKPLEVICSRTLNRAHALKDGYWRYNHTCSRSSTSQAQRTLLIHSRD